MYTMRVGLKIRGPANLELQRTVLCLYSMGRRWGSVLWRAVVGARHRRGRRPRAASRLPARIGRPRAEILRHDPPPACARAAEWLLAGRRCGGCRCTMHPGVVRS